MASRRSSPRITWDRVRAIFGSPRPPKTVAERQFDGFDGELARMARTPWEEFQFSDLWYYHHDLAHVDLQPDLFAYLFPLCLMDWQFSLLQNKGCSHGDSEFHHAIRQGRVLERMLSPRQRGQVFEFFRDGLSDRLDLEHGFNCNGSHAAAHGWIHRMNSLGCVMPDIGAAMDEWWNLTSPGAAVAWLEYASGLIYGEGENPLFGEWTCTEGGGGPYLWENDSSIYDAGWLPENISQLRRRLTVDGVIALVRRAAARLRGEPEEDTATRIASDLPSRLERVQRRCLDLPRLLSRTDLAEGWTA